MKKIILIAIISSIFSVNSHAAFKVITTTPDIRSLVQLVTQNESDIEVESIAKGTQDPHFIEAKPSFMVKLSRADLVISTGLELEQGWLPSILSGARNPKVNPGSDGNLELGPSLDPLEVPNKNVTRADGDVHPSGNPHVFLDPIRAGKAAKIIAERFSKLIPSKKSAFNANAERFAADMDSKTKAWTERIKKTGISKIVTYHKTLTYFLNRFGIENPAILEPKPGIPPSSGHIIEVIKLMKEQNIKLVMIENYFDSSASKKIQEEIAGARVRTVPVSVDGAADAKSLTDLYESLVKTIEAQ